MQTKSAQYKLEAATLLSERSVNSMLPVADLTAIIANDLVTKNPSSGLIFLSYSHRKIRIRGISMHLS